MYRLSNDNVGKIFLFEKLDIQSCGKVHLHLPLAIFTDCDKIAFVDDHTAKLPSFSRSLLPR